MRRYIEYAMGAARKYTVWDFAWLKVTLITLGILLGTYFADFFLHYTSVLWIIFAASYLFILYRTFVVHWR